VRATIALTGVLLFVLCSCGNLCMAESEQEDDFAFQRELMVRQQLIARGIRDEKVLKAIRKVRRHLFVPPAVRNQAYIDSPLPIGFGQTISQPYIVAYMTEAADLKGEERVLEIGTGSGYQAAVLAEIVKEVYTIEILKPLAETAAKRLSDLGYTNIKVRCGDGYLGWEEYAPFDVIIVTAAPDEVPERLLEQLKEGGRMIIPVGSFYQELYRITKIKGRIEKESLLPVRFVPMIKGADKKG